MTNRCTQLAIITLAAAESPLERGGRDKSEAMVAGSGFQSESSVRTEKELRVKK